MKLNEAIIAIRKEMGLSQKKFAEKVHVSFSTVNRWENAHVVPNQLAIATLISVCESEGISQNLIDEIHYTQKH